MCSEEHSGWPVCILEDWSPRLEAPTSNWDFGHLGQTFPIQHAVNPLVKCFHQHGGVLTANISFCLSD